MKDRIKTLRVKEKMNQTQLGEILGVSQDAISKIEKGINNPTVMQIAKMAEIFNVTTDFIINGNESAKDIEPIEREILKTIRDDSTLYGKLIKMIEAKKMVFEDFDHFERLAA
ncbi:MAG: helix-turn-helix transcriptional regulator [Methylococcales bacterium]|nr:helix-turn-helix transcriptional regulator [Methylococcales bacterium]